MLYSVKLQAQNFGTANVKNNSTQQNKGFGPADKKAIFETFYK
jgi:hypothetical protein